MSPIYHVMYTDAFGKFHNEERTGTFAEIERELWAADARYWAIGCMVDTEQSPEFAAVTVEAQL